MILKKKRNITVVIPSLGSSVLLKTIFFLNQGIIKPDKILICLPKGSFPKIGQIKKFRNVKIIQCPEKGQVKQKIYGFKQVVTKYTLQMDDDILVSKTCLKEFLRAANSKSKKNAFGGYLKSTNNNLTKYVNPSLFNQILNLLLHGTRYIKMRSVLNTGIPTNLFDQKIFFLVKTEWINGILFTHSINLLNYDYYNIEGKAYNEDVIHSGILRKKNITLWVNNKAICSEQRQNLIYQNEKYNIQYWINIYKTRSKIIQFYKGSKLRMTFLIFLEIGKLLLIKNRLN